MTERMRDMFRAFRTSFLLLAVLPTLLRAQYFGRNKVQYRQFEFKIVQTEHFDVHYYEDERVAALDIARLAERSYARLSRVLNHQFAERKPIIIYGSHSEFQQTNITGVSEGEQGVTDYLRHRNVFTLLGSYADNEHVLQHEMVHQFQFDIWSRGRGLGGVQGIVNANAPGWFAEGMAEYFSLGPTNPETAMWLRDAALEGKLPSARDFDRIFPYRFGHAMLTYIGQRWGDEAIGAITKTAVSGGVDNSLRRVLGINFEQLVSQWQDAVQKQYLPEIGSRQKARAVATPLLTEKISEGTLHVAPALAPDGSLVAYFSEGNSYFVDLYLANGNSGRMIKRLLKSTFSSNYETYRYINSASSWSPDGKYIAFAAGRNGKDDIIIIDPRENREVRRLEVPLSGVLTPTWSPDGKKLVFTGLDGGISDLFTINTDGTDLRRLTNDKYAELHPVWSPDGKTIAFTTDRGPKTDFKLLTHENFRTALYHMDTGVIEVVAGMDQGRNVSPQWSPDGHAMAFVSDRTGINNIYMHDFDTGETYPITDFYTGVQGITSLSPVLSWAREADRLAFVYFEQGKYDVYTVTNPRLQKRTLTSVVASTPDLSTNPSVNPPVKPATPGAQPANQPQVLSGGTIYRTQRGGFRRADSAEVVNDSLHRGPISIVAAMDSVTFVIPDTTEFTYRNYHVKLEPEYVSRPTIGYTRDNFGRGITGQTTIVLGDMLGDHQLIVGAGLNGRLPETQFLASYVNQTHRTNWGVSAEQQPYFFYNGQGIDTATGTSGVYNYVTSIRRLVFRTLGAQLYHPFSRFSRVEAGLSVNNVDDAELRIVEPYDASTGFPVDNARQETINHPGVTYLMPSVSYTFDNSLFGYTGPFMGRRSRFEVSQAIGGWQFTQGLVDYRRYDRLLGPFTLATRVMYFGRSGRDADRFQVFGGNPDLLRGYTYGSFQNNECVDPNSAGCATFNQLIGSQLAVASAEIRFPLLYAALGFLPIGFPPIEGAFFYDAGVVWDGGSHAVLTRTAGQDPLRYRSPLTSYGASIRANVLGFLILRVDYAVPRQRTIGGFWTVSLGPTF